MSGPARLTLRVDEQDETFIANVPAASDVVWATDPLYDGPPIPHNLPFTRVRNPYGVRITVSFTAPWYTVRTLDRDGPTPIYDRLMGAVNGQ